MRIRDTNAHGREISWRFSGKVDLKIFKWKWKFKNHEFIVKMCNIKFYENPVNLF